MTEFHEFDYEESRRQTLEKEIDDVIVVAATFYKRIKKWNPDLSELEAKKIALNIAVTRKYEPNLDVNTNTLEYHLDYIGARLADISENLSSR